MIIYAAIDLRGGRVVQLVGGRTDAERVSLPDPLATARRWTAAGFRALHVVDLDAALTGTQPGIDDTADAPAASWIPVGTGGENRAGPPGAASPRDNAAVIERIVRAVDVPVQVGGGVRDEAAVRRLFQAGADRAIAGTRAVEDPDWLARVARRHPLRIIAAVDVRGEDVVSHGWTRRTGYDARAVLGGLDALPLGAVLVTDVAREGRMQGVDATRFRRLVASTRHPLIAAGGIRDVDDLRALEAAGAAGAVLGMALYSGTIDPATLGGIL